MKKRTEKAFGKKIFLLGKDANGARYWLEAATWDCDWYWGFGYITTYTNNINPSRARDIDSLQHFNRLFLLKNKSACECFNNFFVETTLTENEIWQLLELMKTFYIMRDYSDALHRGGSNYATNPIKDIIKNDDEYNRINKSVLPELFNSVYQLLED